MVGLGLSIVSICSRHSSTLGRATVDKGAQRPAGDPSLSWPVARASVAVSPMLRLDRAFSSFPQVNRDRNSLIRQHAPAQAPSKG